MEQTDHSPYFFGLIFILFSNTAKTKKKNEKFHSYPTCFMTA